MNSASQHIRPHRIWYAVAALVLLAGAAVFAILLVSFITGITALPQSMTRVLVPSASDIKLDQPGDYTIFDEYQSVVAGRAYSNPAGLGGLTCTLTDKSTGRTIPITAATSSANYSMGSYSGRSIFQFTIPSPGIYTLTAQYPGGDPTAPQAVLSIGHGFMRNILGSIAKMFAAVAALIASIFLSILIFLITIIRRSTAIRRLRENTA